VALVGGRRRWGKGVGGCMYVSEKTRSVETTLVMEGGRGE
jgi:hypothetical protein